MAFKSGTPKQDTSDLGLVNMPYSLKASIPALESTSAGSVGRTEEYLRELNGKQFELMVEAGYT